MKKNKIIAIIIGLIIVIGVGIGLIIYNFNSNKKVITYFDEATKIENKDLLEMQNTVDKEIESKIKKGNYSIENPLVIVNPYKIAPLTALIYFETDNDTEVTLQVMNKNNQIEITNTFAKTKEHYIQVYGLYADYENNVVIKANGKTNTIKIKTNKLDNVNSNVKVIKNPNATQINDLYFASSPVGYNFTAFDSNGIVRWYLTGSFLSDIQELKNGHLLISSNKPGSTLFATSGLYEIDLLGKIYKEYYLMEGYHHDVEELENGNLLVASSNLDAKRYRDYIIEVDRNTGKVVKNFDLFEILKDVDSEYAANLNENWAWNNSVFYDKKTNSLIASLRDRDSIISIDYDTKKINWIIGEKSDWSLNFQKYILNVEGSLKLPKGQHSVKVLDNGNISLFNNGYSAIKQEITLCSDLKTNVSSAQILSINKESKTVKEVWNYNLGHEKFSYALSNFYLLPNGNKLINSGWILNVDNVNDPNCNTTFLNNLSSTTLELDNDDNIVFEMNLNYGVYSVKKINLYSTISNFNLKNGIKYSDVIISENSKISNEEITLIEKAEEEFNINFTINSERFQNNGVYPDDFEVNLVFLNSKKEGYKYSFKEKDKLAKPFLYLDKDKIGKSLVYIEVNGKYYKTNKYIEVK